MGIGTPDSVRRFWALRTGAGSCPFLVYLLDAKVPSTRTWKTSQGAKMENTKGLTPQLVHGCQEMLDELAVCTGLSVRRVLPAGRP